MIHVADCAYPTDWHDLPKDVQVVLGYVGDVNGTPHVWTVAEIASVGRTGRHWGPIWTPPQPPFGKSAGTRAAAGMVAALEGLHYPKAGPVFLDIEHATWEPAPHTVMVGVDAWKAGMHAAGWSHTYAYLPAAAQTDWVADWVGQPPEHLAPGVVGVQYAGEVMGGRYDLSVFNPAVFAGLLDPTEAPVMSLTLADQHWLDVKLVQPVVELRHALTRIYGDHQADEPRPFALRHLSDKLDELLADVARPRPASVDVQALAKALAAQLGHDVGGQLVHALAAQLAK